MGFGRTTPDRQDRTSPGGSTWGNRGVYFNNLQVTPPSPWPRVAILTPTNGATLGPPDAVSISVAAFDPDSQVNRIELLSGGSTLAVLTNAPYFFQWTNLSPVTYTVTARLVDAVGRIVLSPPVSFKMTPPLPQVAFLNQPANQYVCWGGSAAFWVRTAGPLPVSYQWLLNDVPIDGATNAWLILDNAQPWQAGTYSVIVSNQTGAAGSQPASLDLDMDAQPVLDPDTPPSLGFAGVNMLDPGVPLISVAATNVGLVNIEWSADWQTWSPLTTLTNVAGLVYFADSDAVSQPLRFYRAYGESLY